MEISQNMLNKLGELSAKYDTIQEQLANPDIASNQGEYRRLMRESKYLSVIVDKYREYRTSEQAVTEAREILASSDLELHDLAEEEMLSGREVMGVIAEELTVLLLPRDENDDKNVIVEIRAGAGGEEAALFVGTLYRMYSMYADSRGWKHDVLSANETGIGGYREISFEVNGDGAFSRLKFESGVHRVQRVPETESSGRIHTSTVTVAVLPEAEDVEVDINMEDVEVSTHRSSGAGGQHVNKTDSAVRLVHKPSGIVVDCQDERSQTKNRDKAMKLLRTKLYDLKLAEQKNKIDSERKSQVGTGDRSERIRTYNYSQGRVSDHRIGLTLYSLENFLNGDIDAMITALINADTAEKLKSEG